MIQPTYGSKTALTVSGLNSLANGSSATSNALDNTSSKYLDIVFQLTYQYGTAPTAGNAIVISVLGSLDGTTYDDIVSVPVLNVPLTADTNAHNTSFFLNSLFGGITPPPYIKIKITNNGGQALASSGNALNYIGINY